MGRENWSSLIGIITAISGNVLIAFALNMQRYAHIRLEREWQMKEKDRKKRNSSHRATQANMAEERTKAARTYHPPRCTRKTVEREREEANEADPLIPSHSNARMPSLDPTARSDRVPEAAFKQQSYLKSPYWWAGIILMTTGEAGNFLAYGFAPASIVSPLGVVALISNCIIAPFMLKEPLRKRDGLGVLVAVGGAVTVVLSANDNNPKLGPHEIWDLITRWEFETYLGITAGVIICLMFASNKYGDKNILIDLGVVGLFGGFTALSTKGVASMLSYTLWRAITFPVTYLLASILIFTAIMQIKYINRALQRFDATQVIPVQFVTFTLSVILGSAILYRDFERTSGEDAGKFVGGCALTFTGVWLITSGRSRRNNEDDENREPEGEEAINLADGERYHDDADDIYEEDDVNTDSGRSSTSRASSPPIAIDTRTSSRRLSTPHKFVPLTPGRPSTAGSNISPLTSDPRQQDPSGLRPPPAPLGHDSSISAPLLPSEFTASAAASASNPELATSPPPPRTPTRGISDNIVPLTPSTAHALTPRIRRMGTAERLNTRTSISGPLLASPLSTSLSAMVADLKRGGSFRGQHDFPDSRSRGSVLGVGLGAGGVGDEEGMMGEPLDHRRTVAEEGREPRPAQGRGRSLSGTIGELWRGLRRGSAGEEESRRPEFEER
ncbi:DUF803-domain-containing protein [Pleomassaria siparia CBS 279.74]|uniref:DUF803-domain-containing protein n=1 Tax=Pleomassaria siparia CBS 279.74 TaxID=1314801 RepID=A0A6G1KR18_9PLEO|nr:DUF803-domain-containing protein [Pleomassaria siparia CBS 279.74]